MRDKHQPLWSDRSDVYGHVKDKKSPPPEYSSKLYGKKTENLLIVFRIPLDYSAVEEKLSKDSFGY